MFWGFVEFFVVFVEFLFVGFLCIVCGVSLGCFAVFFLGSVGFRCCFCWAIAEFFWVFVVVLGLLFVLIFVFLLVSLGLFRGVFLVCCRYFWVQF